MTTEGYTLVIGNKNWSSWSLRPWLALKRFALPFDETSVRLRRPESKAEILKHSPSGLVPVLFDGEIAIWDSLAILEYLADRHPDLEIWPRQRDARAMARAVSAEMHAGFAALRQHCPMDLLSRAPLETLPADVEGDIRRIVALWQACRTKFGGSSPFLFSRFSAADAMYAPVASRLRTYVPDLSAYGDDGTAKAYVETIFAMPEMDAWADGARAEMAEES